MNEIQSIIQLARDSQCEGRLALATVVSTEGSVYRRPGARMLVTEAGRTAGMISGGCLESDVREHSYRVMASGVPVVVTYDSTSPEDIVFGLGLGCSGVVRVMIEPFSSGSINMLLEALGRQAATRETVTTATVFECRPAEPGVVGSRIIRTSGNFDQFMRGADDVRLALERSIAVGAVRRHVSSHVRMPDGRVLGILVERIEPPTRLIVFGAGDDAIPVVAFAKGLGWHVVVVDYRATYLTAERFPRADALLFARPEEVKAAAADLLQNDTLAVIMTHSYLSDKELLRNLLPLDLRYLGILGPKTRTCRLMEDLEEEGFQNARSFARLNSPCGLDIGAETPEEVAISIIAEMQAVIAGRDGGHLKQRFGSIHGSASEEGTE